jgi:hypothetical protein
MADVDLSTLHFSSYADLRLCCWLRVFLEKPPLSGRSSFPLMESAEERIGIFVA